MHLNPICQYFFGRDDLYQHPEFNGAHKGFDIALGKRKKETPISDLHIVSPQERARRPLVKYKEARFVVGTKERATREA
jgi:hypothetical protein